MRNLVLLGGWLLVAVAGSAEACGDVGLPDLGLSVVSWHAGGGVTATLLVVPDGSGASLAAARDPLGLPVDATIDLLMLDGCGAFIAGFPREDIWLEAADGGLALCNAGTIADHNTDQQGRTTWALPLKAGGHSQAACRVLINGWQVLNGGSLPLHFNSPDINGDRVANLADIALFAADYAAGANAFEADLLADGVVNISDIGVLARGVGASCP